LLATDPDGRQLALKVLKSGRVDAGLARFKREFRAMRRVQHPNVIRVFEAGTHDKCHYFTMEFVDGKDIHVWLDGPAPIVPGRHRPPSSEPLTVEQRERLNDPTRLRRLAEAVVQVGLALTAIHAHRIVHRDLKPDNILVSHAGVVKLMDFGIAKTLAQQSEHSSSGMVLGTFKYLSPEQALGSDVDGRADLYCLGVILYELLAGRHPFYSENSVGYAFHHARNAPPPLRRFNPEVHPGLAAICERLLSKDPSDRYSTAEDVVDAIRGAVDGMVSVEVPAAQATAPTPGPTSHASLFSPAMIGRDTESRKLLALAEQVRKGRGSTALVRGGRHMGKSRLMRDVAAKCRANSIDAFVGEALEGGRGDDQPFLQIFEAMLRSAAQSHGPDEMKRLLGRDGSVLARYLPALPAIARKPIKPAIALDPKSERARFLGAASGLLERAAMRRPCVLVVDGLERADELTLDLARHLIELCNAIGPTQESGAFRLCPIGLFLTVDPSADDDATARRLLADYEDSTAVLSLTLGPLDVEEVGELMQSMIGGGNIGSAISEALHERTRGVPGRVEEQIRAWAQAGDLVRQRREWVLVKGASSSQRPSKVSKGSAPAQVPGATKSIGLSHATRADIPIPNFDDGVDDGRLDQLPAVARSLVEQAAVLGERVDQRTLLRCALLHEDEFLDAIDDVLRAGVLVADDERSAFRFPQSSVRRSLLERLPQERRAQLHRLAGRVLEAESERGAPSQYAAVL
ncbi:MAG: serine/threonine-protein kinase PknK, partial [Myxococcota bacterium]